MVISISKAAIWFQFKYCIKGFTALSDTFYKNSGTSLCVNDYYAVGLWGGAMGRGYGGRLWGGAMEGDYGERVRPHWVLKG